MAQRFIVPDVIKAGDTVADTRPALTQADYDAIARLGERVGRVSNMWVFVSLPAEQKIEFKQALGTARDWDDLPTWAQTLVLDAEAEMERRISEGEDLA